MTLFTGLCYGQMYDPSASQGLPNGMLGQSYNATIDVTVPATTTVNVADFGIPFPAEITAQISTVTLSVAGLPAGITYSCSAGGCAFAGGSTGTITISGTPTASGSFTVDITSLTDGSADVPTLGVTPFPQPVPNLFDEPGYAMQVYNPNGIAEVGPVSGLTVMESNVPGTITIEMSAARPMTVVARVMDIQGKLAATQEITLAEGVNRVMVPTGYTSGVHVLTLQGEEVNLVRRFVK